MGSGHGGFEQPSRPQSATANTSTPMSQSQQAFPARSVERSHGHESKPRLSKEQSHVLETAFQQCHKPSTNVKKGFSKKLGLPAQKVNNWFQNRRAKQKQYQKKQQSQNPFYGHLQFSGHPLQDSSYIDAAFYHVVPSSQNQAHSHSRATIHPGTAPFSASEYANSLNASQSHNNLSTTNGQLNSNSVQSSPHHDSGLGGIFTGLTDPVGDGQNADLSGLATLMKGFNPHETIIDEANPSSQPQLGRIRNAGLGMNTAQQDMFSQSPGMRMPISAATTSNTRMPVLPGTWNLGENGIVSDFSEEANKANEPQPSYLASEANLRQQTNMNDMKISTNITAPGFMSQFSQAQPPQLLEPTSSIPQSSLADTPSRAGSTAETSSYCSSAAEMFQEPFNDETSPCDGRIPTPASATSHASGSLANRRRRKPAALGPAALGPAAYRSTSYTSGAPSSPRTGAAGLSDANLRRVQSSSVVSPRIQKISSVSAQRSPLRMSFTDVTTSPKLSRQVSNQSGGSAAVKESTENQMAPTTPISEAYPANQGGQDVNAFGDPSEPASLAHNNVGENPDQIWQRMPDTAVTSESAFWSNMPSTADTLPSYASPPYTPMNHSHMTHLDFFKANMHSNQAESILLRGPENGNSGLHSAPPHQQGFHFQPGLGHVDTSIPPVHNPITTGSVGSVSNIRGSSPNDNGAGMMLPNQQPWDSNAQFMHQVDPAHNFNFHMTQALQSGLNGHCGLPMHKHQMGPKLNLSNETPSHFSPHGTIMGHLRSASGPVGRGQDLQVHHYNPPRPADPSVLPPRQKFSEQPREFNFENKGPEHFSLTESPH
ncbi:MAG: hypothetical protein M1831_005780 [Alyxoria varia]|nr:MAG: hypothetical protein M1831_005780 [Alyxoria varia]